MLSGQGFSSLIPPMWHRGPRRKRERHEKGTREKGSGMGRPLSPPLPPAPPGSKSRRRSCSGLVARFLDLGDRLFEVGGDLGAHVFGQAARAFTLGKGLARLLQRRQP